MLGELRHREKGNLTKSVSASLFSLVLSKRYRILMKHLHFGIIARHET